MSLFTKYFDTQGAQEIEAPPDTLAVGEYPGKVINAKCEAQRGTSTKSGKPFAFGQVALQVQVTHGPAKGTTTWIRPAGFTAPDKTNDDGTVLDEATFKRRHYQSAKFYDSTGLGVKLDPDWKRIEKPNPNKPGKTSVTFKGNMLSRAALLAIADNPSEAEAFVKLLIGLTGVWTLGEKENVSERGTFVEQTLKAVEPLNETTLAAALAKATKATGTANGTPTTSIYG